MNEEEKQVEAVFDPETGKIVYIPTNKKPRDKEKSRVRPTPSYGTVKR